MISASGDLNVNIQNIQWIQSQPVSVTRVGCGGMDDQHESLEFGEFVTDPTTGLRWFSPAPMPRRLPLQEQTQLALSRADDAIGKLAGVAELLPNPAPLVGPYTYMEALASAQIEGTQADLEDVFQAARRPSEEDQDFLTVRHYRDALFSGLERIKQGDRLTFEMVLSAHGTLLGPDVPEPGQVRSREVWLGSPTGRPETAVFVPPIGTALHDSLADWQDFLQEPPPMPALIRAALLHYQLLTIHPFLDGNGRTARLLVLLFLAAEGRLPVPLLYISPFFERRRREYYDRLQAVREYSEIQQWCQYFLSAVEAQANDGVTRARQLLELRERYRLEVLGSRSRSGEVVEMLFENAYVTSTDVRERLGISNQGALNLIRSLERRGWLRRVGSIGRGGGTLWVAWEIFATMSHDQPDDTKEAPA